MQDELLQRVIARYAAIFRKDACWLWGIGFCRP